MLNHKPRPAPRLPAVTGAPVEMSRRDADDFGAFEETALSEHEAAESNHLPPENMPDDQEAD